MSDTTELIRAILADPSASDETALGVLEDALERESDPLDYCAAVLGIGQALVMERAARWAQLSFFDVVPRDLMGQTEPMRLDALAHVTAFHVRLFDRDVFFSAPDFFQLLRLKARRRVDADIARRICLVPAAALRDYLVRINAPHLVEEARQRLARRWPYAAAQLELTRPIRMAFALGLMAVTGLVLLAPFVGQPVLLPIAAVLLIMPSGIRIAAMLCRPQAQQTAPPFEPGEMPVYSVLLPLRDEAHMVPQLVSAMRALDYPAEKLDIKFVVEQRSAETLAAVSAYLGDARFSMLPVPDAAPRTKPKALDFALPLCRGEFVVVFDAEDTPHPDQLRQAVARFRAGPDLQCIQAELYIDNAQENWLAGLFAAEYAGIFRVLLPALAEWNWPMPLGGTSNHFRVETLKDIGGWDAFNVTEDADLGARLARLGHRCETMLLPTQEEAPTQFFTWMGQRTRWMKGWMQTFIVHNRNPAKLLADMGPWNMLAFEMTALGMIVSPLLHGAFFVIIAARLALGLPALPQAELAWTSPYIAMLVLGYGSAVAMPALGVVRQKRFGLLFPFLAMPLYWLLIGMATLKALHELVEKPFHWNKTRHRAVRRGRGGAAPAPVVVEQA